MFCRCVDSTTVSSPNNAENDFRAIMKDARNEELVQEQERKERSRNLIIHGVPELKEGNDSIKNKSHDEEFVNKFLNKNRHCTEATRHPSYWKTKQQGQTHKDDNEQRTGANQYHEKSPKAKRCS